MHTALQFKYNKGELKHIFAFHYTPIPYLFIGCFN